MLSTMYAAADKEVTNTWLLLKGERNLKENKP